MAPLDHVRNLYADTAATLPAGRNRRILQKKDLIHAIRTMSPVKLGGSSKSASAPSLSLSSGGLLEQPDPTVKALAELEMTVNTSARRYNELKILADKKAEQLKQLQDDLAELEVENTALGKISAKQTPESLRIEALDAEIEAINSEMEEKEFQHRQLLHMSERLRKNQLMFDAHIKSMEDALKAGRKELNDVTGYLRQLEIAKDEAMIEMKRTQAKLAGDRRARERELAERQAEVTAARKMDEWRQQREMIRQEMAAEMRGDLSADQEARLTAALAEKEAANEALKLASKERADRAAALEEAFMAIKQATGVSTVEEMVDKFLNQDSTQQALEADQVDAEAKLAKVKKAKEAAATAFASMKASGLGGVELNRDMYIKLEEEIAETKAQLKVSKASSERLQHVLVAVRQGAVGLAQRLAPFNYLLGFEDVDPFGSSTGGASAAGAGSGAGESGARAVDSVETLALLVQCEKKLGVLLEVLGKSATGVAKAPEPAFITEPIFHSNNVRVRPAGPPVKLEALPSTRSSSSSSDEDDKEGGDSDSDSVGERVLFDRAALKKKAIKKESDELRRREAEARRAAMAAKIAVDLDKKATMERLTAQHPEATGMTFLTQKPGLL